MIMTFVIESAFGSHEHSILILHVAEFCFGIPSHVRHIMLWSLFGKIIAAKQRLKGAESIVAHCGVWLPAIQQISCKMHHFIAVYRFTKTIDQQRIATTLRGSIGKVHHPTITDIRTGHILSHTPDHRFIQQGYSATRTIGKYLQIIIKLTCRVSPISPFFASAVRLHKVDKLIYRFHRTVYSFCQTVFIVLHQKETLQSIGVAPRIPVIDNLARLPVERHPPHIVIVHIRVKDTLLYSFAHLQRNHRIDFVERFTEEIVHPSHQCTISAGTKINDLFAEIRKRTFAALPGQVSRQYP